MSGSHPCRILVADDHHAVRCGLTSVLNQYPHLQVVGEAKNGSEAVQMTAELEPDLVLMDLHMPVLDGATATREIKDRHPDTKVVILTGFDTEASVLSGIQAGADAYLLKEIWPDELATAISQVMHGQWVAQPRVASRVLARLTRHDRRDPECRDLSDRELQVLGLVAEGLPNKAIGERLFISSNTVRSHLSHIFDKLGTQDRTQAVTEAARRGLLAF